MQFYEAISEMHPNKKSNGHFHPHLFSRTTRFADEVFAKKLVLNFENMFVVHDYLPSKREPNCHRFTIGC